MPHQKKTFKSTRSLITSSHKQSPRKSKYGLPHFNPPLSVLLSCNPSLVPSVLSSLRLSSGECVSPPPTRVGRVKAGVQFQLSEADPLLLMALRGLRDTEPLFFQRTEKGKRQRVSCASLAAANEHPTNPTCLPERGYHLRLPTSALGFHRFPWMCLLQHYLQKCYLSKQPGEQERRM